MAEQVKGRDVDYSRTITGTAGDPVRPCCDEARATGAGLQALPSVRLDEAGEVKEYGYALQPKDSPCDCKAVWMVHDWRKGHAEFVPRSQAEGGQAR